MRNARPLGWSAAVLVLTAATWLVYVGTLATQELLLGALCVVLGTLASLLTWKAMQLSIAIVPADLLQIWRVPLNVLIDAGTLLAILCKDLCGVAPASSHDRAVPFHDPRGRHGRLRRVLITAYTSISPNTIVIGIDREKRLLLFHQLAPKPVDKLMRRLGAHP